jgi:pilus assembly protein CpaF
VTPHERDAEATILADVRADMERVFGAPASGPAPQEQRVAELVADRIERYQRVQVNANQPILPDPEASQERILDSLLRLGPLEPLMRDPHVEEIIINAPADVGVIRRGQMVLLPDVVFRDDAEVRELVRRALAPVGRRLDESSPLVDARLDDGSRLHVVIPPVSDEFTLVNIRKFHPDIDSLERGVELGTLDQLLCQFLTGAVRSGVNIVVSGGTGTGKTTMLNMLGNAVEGAGERILIVEETRELRLPKLIANCKSLEARLPNQEGKGEITQRELVRHALRMRPTRIVVGEARGPEALDVLTAMNTGHPGSMTSVHANTAFDALDRLNTMVSMAPERLSTDVIDRLIGRAVNLVVHMQLEPGTGRRLIWEVLELTGLDGGRIKLQHLWNRDPATGQLRWTGITPACRPRFEERGLGHHLPHRAAGRSERLA